MKTTGKLITYKHPKNWSRAIGTYDVYQGLIETDATEIWCGNILLYKRNTGYNLITCKEDLEYILTDRG